MKTVSCFPVVQRIFGVQHQMIFCLLQTGVSSLPILSFVDLVIVSFALYDDSTVNRIETDR